MQTKAVILQLSSALLLRELLKETKMRLKRLRMVSPMSSLMEFQNSRRKTVLGMVQGCISQRLATKQQASEHYYLLGMTVTTTTDTILCLHHEIAVDLEI